eukprot:1346503-Amphidinium_carterae.1
MRPANKAARLSYHARIANYPCDLRACRERRRANNKIGQPGQTQNNKTKTFIKSYIHYSRLLQHVLLHTADEEPKEMVKRTLRKPSDNFIKPTSKANKLTTATVFKTDACAKLAM